MKTAEETTLRFLIEDFEGRVFGESFVRRGGDERSSFVENSSDLGWGRREIRATYRGALLMDLRYRQSRASNPVLDDIFWIERMGNELVIKHRRLNETWEEARTDADDLFFNVPGLLLGFFRIAAPEKQNALFVPTFTAAPPSMGRSRISRVTSRSSIRGWGFRAAPDPSSALLRMDFEPKCGFVKIAPSYAWVEMGEDGPWRISYPDGGLRIQRFVVGDKVFPSVDIPEVSAETIHIAHKDPTGREEEVSFTSADGTVLKGSLESPLSATGLPTAILIHGSGPETRDSGCGYEGRDIEYCPGRPFRELSRKLVARGIPTLRYDKRGVGESEGDYPSATKTDLLEDLLAACRSVHPANPAGVVLVGSSEGANLAITAAQRTDGISGIVCMGGPANAIDTVILRKTAERGKITGEDGESLEARLAHMKDVFDRIRLLSESDGEAPEGFSHMGFSFLWWAEHLKTVPKEEAKTLTCPVLLLHGSKDLEVLVEECEALKSALEEADVSHEMIVFEELGHFFTKAFMQSPGFDYDIPFEMPDEVPDSIVRFVRSLPKIP